MSSLSSAITHLLNAKRISAASQSYAKDNPGEWAKVKTYLTGGVRPTGVVTEMGLGLVEVEDVRRGGASLGFQLPTYRVTEPAGGGFHSFFVTHDSPNRQIVGAPGDTSGDRHSIVMWSTAGGGALPPAPAYYAGLTMYALVGYRMVLGFPGRSFDWHTQPNDQPWGWVPPGSGGGVAPLAIDLDPTEIDGVTGNHRGIHYVNEPDFPNHQHQIMSVAEAETRRGQWTWLWLKVVFGPTGGLDGAMTIWVAGEDTPRVNLTGIKTVWPQEHQLTFWEGAYNSSGFPTAVDFEFTATRLGRTPKECYEDVPVQYDQWAVGSGGTMTKIAPRSSTEAAVPASLRWS